MRAQIWEGPRRGQRPRSEGGHYQWLGNTTSVDDDAHGFYDRSLGAVENSLAAGKPYQLARADNVTLGGGRTGSLRASYDDAGSMTGLTVRRDGPCLPVGASCSHHYGYQWDEVGRLVRARRWDLSGTDANAYLATPPAAGGDAVADAHGPAQADLGYAYDAGDQRRLKRAVDEEGEASHTVYVFPSLELRSTSFGPGAVEGEGGGGGGGGGGGEAHDYVRTEWTETVYLFANGVRLARLAWEEELPTLTGSKLHVFLELGDHLGSTAAVLDLDTSELVERTTYLAYGGTESDYRPARWGAFREDYRFTGKEEDTEVGLTYFGKRFLSASLGRWMSADPLAVHAPGQADLNLYAYVSGRVLQAVDPVGLMTGEADASEQVAVNIAEQAAAPAPPSAAGAMCVAPSAVDAWGYTTGEPEPAVPTSGASAEQSGGGSGSTNGGVPAGLAIHAGTTLLRDGSARTQYEQAVALISPGPGAENARNLLKEATREAMTPLGRATSELADLDPARVERAAARALLTDAERAVSTSASRTSSAFNTAGKMSTVGGGALVALSVGVSAYRVAEAAPEERARVASQEVGASAGGAAGGWAGAEVGGVIGAFFGPIGAVIGALIGGLGGGAAGGHYGQQAGNAAYERVTGE